jgi:hypothetical protein
MQARSGGRWVVAGGWWPVAGGRWAVGGLPVGRRLPVAAISRLARKFGAARKFMRRFRTPSFRAAPIFRPDWRYLPEHSGILRSIRAMPRRYDCDSASASTRSLQTARKGHGAGKPMHPAILALESVAPRLRKRSWTVTPRFEGVTVHDNGPPSKGQTIWVVCPPGRAGSRAARHQPRIARLDLTPIRATYKSVLGSPAKFVSWEETRARRAGVCEDLIVRGAI